MPALCQLECVFNINFLYIKMSFSNLLTHGITIHTCSSDEASRMAFLPNAKNKFRSIDPLPCHPGKDQNISGHIVLAQNVCVICVFITYE